MQRTAVIDRRYFVDTAARTIELLHAVEGLGHPASLGELVATLQWSKPTVYRFVRTLETVGALRQTTDKNYVLGPALISLGLDALRSTNVAEVARPHLRRLADAVKETIVLAVLDGDEIVYIDRIDADDILLTPRLELGSRLPAYVTATGKALLAALSDEEVRRRVGKREFRTYGPKAIRSPAALVNELASVRQRGYAVTEDELTVGHRSAATAVRDHTGAVVAAVGVSAPSYRLSPDELSQFVSDSLIPAAAAISGDLGQRQLSTRRAS